MLKHFLIFLIFLEIFSLAMTQEEVQSHIESVEIMVADCDHCGMSTLGHIHVKVKKDISNEVQHRQQILQEFLYRSV